MIKSRVVLLGVLLLLLLACQPQPIKIGAFLSLTGSTAAYGISAANAIKLATEEVNSEGRIKGDESSSRLRTIVRTRIVQETWRTDRPSTAV